MCSPLKILDLYIDGNYPCDCLKLFFDGVGQRIRHGADRRRGTEPCVVTSVP